MDIDSLEKVILLLKKYELTEIYYETSDATFSIKKERPSMVMASSLAPHLGPYGSPEFIASSENHCPAAADNRSSTSMVPVKASLVGIFYRATDPASPPLGALGQTVKLGDPIGLIEAMKVLTLLSAPCDGKIKKICVENGEVVEFDQTLFLIAPES